MTRSSKPNERSPTAVASGATRLAAPPIAQPLSNDSGDVADHPYKTQFEAFFAALDRDEEMPLSNLAEALKTFEVIFAADMSAAKGRPVRLSEMR